MYTLHHIDDWASLIIRLALEEMGVDYHLHRHDYDAGSLDRDDFRALNPQGLIPVLETPDGPIFETAAILLWLADRHGAMAPTGPERTVFLSWFMFISNTLHPTVMALAHPERVAGQMHETAACQSAHARLKGQCDLLEDMVATSPPWLDAQKPSVLSPYLAVLLRWAQMLAADRSCALDLAPYPHLLAHLRALEAHPAFARVTLAEALGPTPFSNPQE